MASPAKKKSEVRKRIPHREPAEPAKTRSLGSMGFKYAGARVSTSNYSVMLQSRIDEPLAEEMAAFANDNAMSPSETVRHLLHAGLEKEKKRK